MTASADHSAPDFKDAPYWWEAAPPSKAAVPALPDRPEVAIVGAGYCGLSAALELRRHGVGVLVVDAARIGHAASSLNGWVVSGQLKIDFPLLGRAVGPGRANPPLEGKGGCVPLLEEALYGGATACDHPRTRPRG